MLNLIKKFTSAFSVSGREGALASIIEKEIKPFVDSTETDALGNLIAFKKGADSSKRLMIAAHMDEIGFVASYITDKGFIRVDKVGGISPLYSAYGRVRFENGVTGVIVTDASAKGELKVKDLVIDIGAKTKREAEKKVKIGDLCALVPEITRLMNRRYSAKAFDDRLGCAVAVKAAMDAKKPAFDTYYVFCVQEEVGLRGSKPAAFNIAPHYSIAVDVTATGDTVGAKPMEVSLGKGAAIKIKDSSVICSKLMVDAMVEQAKEKKIPYQLEVLEAGGTDTASMQIAGVGSHAGCISIPTRYIHSPVETVDLADVEACVKLLTAMVENLK